ncbi:MAG: hypothetical protein R3A51_00320 [Nannocystaceae bacterium]
MVANVDATPYRDAAAVRDRLVRQVTGRVRWEASVQALVAAGVTRAYETRARSRCSRASAVIDRGLAVLSRARRRVTSPTRRRVDPSCARRFAPRVHHADARGSSMTSHATCDESSARAIRARAWSCACVFAVDLVVF